MSAKQQMMDWLAKHGACPEGREWAKKECVSLDDVWAKAKREWLLWVAHRALTKRQRVAFGTACAERVLHLMKDERSRNAVAVAKLYGSGDATDEELKSAAAAAAYAADAAAALWQASWRSAADSAYAAYASAYAAYASASAAAYAAAAYAAAAYAADAADERKWQIKHLRENFKPDWTL